MDKNRTYLTEKNLYFNQYFIIIIEKKLLYYHLFLAFDFINVNFTLSCMSLINCSKRDHIMIQLCETIFKYFNNKQNQYQYKR